MNEFWLSYNNNLFAPKVENKKIVTEKYMLPGSWVPEITMTNFFLQLPRWNNKDEMIPGVTTASLKAVYFTIPHYWTDWIKHEFSQKTQVFITGGPSLNYNTISEKNNRLSVV